MPTYNYKCLDCNQKYDEIHSMKSSSIGCPFCNSKNINLVPTGFAAKVDQTLEKTLINYEKQAVKDRERFLKDDKFAANLTGGDDPEHAKKLDKVLQDQHKKNQESLKKMEKSNDKNIVKKKS